MSRPKVPLPVNQESKNILFFEWVGLKGILKFLELLWGHSKMKGNVFFPKASVYTASSKCKYQNYGRKKSIKKPS